MNADGFCFEIIAPYYNRNK